jgi:flagellar basal-body rod protein FlgB
MSNPIDGVLETALRGLNLRQQVTANNIANADTPGYHSQVVTFEDQLQQALNNTDPTLADTPVQPQVGDALGARATVDGNTVDMDQQLLSLTETGLRYNAVAKSLSDRLALYKTVVADGQP